MKATQYIKTFGEKNALDTVNNFPDKDSKWYACYCPKCGWGGSSRFLLTDPYDSASIACPVCYTSAICDEDVETQTMSRLVQSCTALKRAGGYDKVKSSINNYRAAGDLLTLSRLDPCVKDWEQIYSFEKWDKVCLIGEETGRTGLFSVVQERSIYGGSKYIALVLVTEKGEVLSSTDWYKREEVRHASPEEILKKQRLDGIRFIEMNIEVVK